MTAVVRSLRAEWITLISFSYVRFVEMENLEGSLIGGKSLLFARNYDFEKMLCWLIL